MKQGVGTRGQTLKYVVPVFIGFSLALELLSHQEQAVSSSAAHGSAQLALERCPAQQGNLQ